MPRQSLYRRNPTAVFAFLPQTTKQFMRRKAAESFTYGIFQFGSRRLTDP